MENPSKMDDLGGKLPIFGNTHIYILWTLSTCDFYETVLSHGGCDVDHFIGGDLSLTGRINHKRSIEWSPDITRKIL